MPNPAVVADLKSCAEDVGKYGVQLKGDAREMTLILEGSDLTINCHGICLMHFVVDNIRVEYRDTRYAPLIGV